jgi:hypothetical protein
MNKLLYNRAKITKYETNSYVEKDPIIKVFDNYIDVDRLVNGMDPMTFDMWKAIKKYCKMKGYKAALELE